MVLLQIYFKQIIIIYYTRYLFLANRSKNNVYLKLNIIIYYLYFIFYTKKKI